MPRSVAIVCSLLAIRLFALEASAERAKRAGDITLYRAPIGLRFSLGAAIIAMVYGAGVVVLSEKRDWWTFALLMALAIFCTSQWPADLEISKSGVSERRWLGLRKRTLAWSDIASAALAHDEESVWVVSKLGVTIKHTKYHVDRTDFVAQMKSHGKWLEPGRTF